MKQIVLGQSVPFKVIGLDQFGRPINFPADAAFQWGNDAIDVVFLSPTDQQSGIGESVSEGSTDVHVQVSIFMSGGVVMQFAAVDTLSVLTVAPVLSSIGIEWGEAF